MATYRKYKVGDYTVIDNYLCKDKNLSLKAKGLLAILLSLPDNWSHSIDGIVSLCKESITAVTSALKELKEQEYVVVEKVLPCKENGGKIDYVYKIYEKPKSIFEAELQAQINQVVENQGVGNRGLYKNTNNQNTKDKNINIYTPQNKTNYDSFVDAFNSTCVSLPKVVKLTDKRKKKIDARLKTFSEQEILSAFAIAEQSDFLSGRSSNWKASFDWIMESDNNMFKILEGNYNHHKKTAMDRLKEAHDRLQEEIDGYERNPNY